MNIKPRLFPLFFVFTVLTQIAWSQCTPLNVRPVFGTVNIGNGNISFTNVPTGNVIQINCPVANTQYLIDACGTNPGTNVPAGTNDGVVTILDQNSPSATELDMFDDNCPNMAAPGWGPPVGTWTAPSAGTFFVYLTEWNSAGTDQCVADGVNNAYDFSITVTAPPSDDLAVDSAYLPSMYTSIAIQQMTTPFSVGARVKNMGSSTATNVGLAVRIRNLATGIVNTQTLSGPASLTGGATANIVGTPYSPPMIQGVYEFRYICSMTQTDGNRSNDTAYRYIAVDTSLLAIDDAILFGTIDNVLGVNNTPAILGQKFVFNVATTIDTIFGYFVIPTANVGDSVQAVIYNTASGVPTTIAASSPIHVFSIADTGGALIPFVFTPNFAVNAGTYYVGMKQIGIRNFGLAHTEQNFIVGNGIFSVSPFTTWNPIEAAGFPGSFLIWVNTKLVCNLSATGTGTSPTCGQNNGAVSLNVTGAGGTPTYNWSNGATSTNLANVGPGTYTVTVSAGGCSTTTMVTLTNNGTQPSLTVTPANAACGTSNGSVSTSVSGGPGPFTYTWSNGAGNVSSISNVPSGSYSVTVTDGTCSASSTTFVGNTGGPSATASNTNVSCNGGSNGTASVNASGGTPNYSYSWSNGGTQSSISNLPAGSYSVTVSDANNCLVTAAVTVSQPAAISSSVSTTPVSCNNGTNGSATATASGGTGALSYAWNNNATTATINNLNPGNYCVTVTDVNNCTVSACQAISNPAALTGTVASTNVSCNGGSNGTATLTAGGGTGTLTYSWSHGSATANVNSLAAGSYSVTITDANNCTTTASATITQPTAINLTSSCTPTIFGQSTGTANVSAIGGTGAYTYNWSNGSTASSASNLPTGLVTVTVTDANNCSASADCDVEFTIGIEETVAGITSLSIYPNPSNGQFNLLMNLKVASTVEVSLLDVRGALVSNEKFNGVISVNKSFDLSNMAKGVYQMKISTSAGSVVKRIAVD